MSSGRLWACQCLGQTVPHDAATATLLPELAVALALGLPALGVKWWSHCGLNFLMTIIYHLLCLLAILYIFGETM